MTTLPRLDKTVVRIKSVEDTETDFDYWQTQSPQVRLATLESIRQEYHKWKYGTEPRLQRICTITQKQSFKIVQNAVRFCKR